MLLGPLAHTFFGNELRELTGDASETKQRGLVTRILTRSICPCTAGCGSFIGLPVALLAAVADGTMPTQASICIVPMVRARGVEAVTTQETDRVNRGRTGDHLDADRAHDLVALGRDRNLLDAPELLAAKLESRKVSPAPDAIRNEADDGRRKSATTEEGAARHSVREQLVDVVVCVGVRP